MDSALRLTKGFVLCLPHVGSFAANATLSHHIEVQ